MVFQILQRSRGGGCCCGMHWFSCLGILHLAVHHFVPTPLLSLYLFHPHQLKLNKENGNSLNMG